MVLDGAIWSSVVVVAVVVAFVLIKVFLRKRAKPKVVDEELSLRREGSIKGAFLFECVVKNDGAKPCFVTDVEIKLPNNGQITEGGRVNVSSEQGRSKAKSSILPLIVSGHEAIPIRVVGRASLESSQCPSRGRVVVTVSGRRRPIIKDFKVNNRYLITRHSFNS